MWDEVATFWTKNLNLSQIILLKWSAKFELRSPDPVSSILILLLITVVRENADRN